MPTYDEWLDRIHALGENRFVDLCSMLLTSYGYNPPRTLKGSGDGGKDIITEFMLKLPETTITQKVFCECKNTASTITQDEIQTKILQIKPHNPDRYVIFSVSDLAAGLVNWIEAHNNAHERPRIDTATGNAFISYLFKSPQQKEIVLSLIHI